MWHRVSGVRLFAMADIQGTCDPGYEAVGDAFKNVFFLCPVYSTAKVLTYNGYRLKTVALSKDKDFPGF